MTESGEQHLPYRATGDVVVLDGDGGRWVRETNVTCPNANRTCPNNVPKPMDADGNAVLLVTMKTYDGEVYEREVREVPLDVLRRAKMLEVMRDE